MCASLLAYLTAQHFLPSGADETPQAIDAAAEQRCRSERTASRSLLA
jgi:hypothetical protein